MPALSIADLLNPLDTIASIAPALPISALLNPVDNTKDDHYMEVDQTKNVNLWAVRPLRLLNLGLRRAPCPFCGVQHYSSEGKTFCCNKGRKLHLYTPLANYPAYMDNTLGHPDLSAKSRKLNLVFTFAAMQSVEHFINHGPGRPAFFSVSGAVYHQLSVDRRHTGFAWYLLDGAHDAARPFLGHPNWDLPAHWITSCKRLMADFNPFAKMFLSMRDLPPADRPELNVYTPTPGVAQEVAAMIFSNNTSAADAQPRAFTVIRPRFLPDGSIDREHLNNHVGYRTRSVPANSTLWEPLAYPLFFPHGEPGAGWDQQTGINLGFIWRTRQLLLREPRFSILGRLTNEYLVNTWSRHLDSVLFFIKKYQVQARHGNMAFGTNSAVHHILGAAVEGEAGDAMEGEGNDVDGEGVTADENIFLPTTFVGGRAWAQQNIANCLALAARFGQPSLFVTMTCNPQWPEIVAALQPGQNFTDIPVTVCRVFHKRLRKLMDDLCNMFPNIGPPTYWVKVIEFQSRGLPHAHILIRYPVGFATAAQVDSVVSACCPSDPADQALVDRFMWHSHNNNNIPAYCQRRSHGSSEPTCRFEYPHALQQHTTFASDGRISYCRINDGDQWVVPYNMELLRRHHCHIDVEVVSASQVFQYLFKYVLKHTKNRIVGLAHQHENEIINEADTFRTGRALSATESAWRILGYRIAEKSIGVECLPVHLQGQQTRRYSTEPGSQGSMSSLLRYFCRPLNTIGHDFDSMLYTDYFTNYRLISPNGRIPTGGQATFRENSLPAGQVGKTVVHRTHLHLARIEPLRPSRVRCHRPWPLAADNKYQLALRDGFDSLNTPAAMRALFVDMLLNNCPSPILLFEEYGDQLGFDYSVRAHGDLHYARQQTLSSLARMLAEHGKSLDDYGLPMPEEREGEAEYHHSLYASRHIALAASATNAYAGLNPEQRSAFDCIYTAAVNQQPLNMFVDGKAGRGKTYMVSALLDRLRSEGRLPMVCATSAFAALLYEGGTTAHSLFKVTINDHSENLESLIKTGDKRAELLKEACCFFWDEAPMVNKAVLSCVDKLLQRVMDNTAPFGGKVFILLGDFRQCAPVIRHGSRAAVIAASIRSSPLWPTFTVHCLITPVRNAADPAMADSVDRIRDGIGGDLVDVAPITITHSQDDLIQHVFPANIRQDATQCLPQAIVCATNKQADEYNNKIAATIDGLSAIRYASDSLKESNDIAEHVEDHNASIHIGTASLLKYYRHTTPSSMPAHNLELRQNSMVRLLRNMSVERGLVKNTRLKVISIGRHTVTCLPIRWINGNPTLGDQCVLIPRITMDYPIPRSPFTLQRRQFPLAMAYATTFNSCQGLTLYCIGIDLLRHAFSHGQTYTAFSRVRHRDDALVLLEHGVAHAANVVYAPLLL